MYQRKNASTSTSASSILPTISPNGYRPNYPTPPNYASGLQADLFPNKSRKKSSLLSKWVMIAVVGFLCILTIYDRFKISRLNNSIANLSQRKGYRDKNLNQPRELKRMQERLDSNERRSKGQGEELNTYKDKFLIMENEKNDLIKEMEQLRISGPNTDNTEINTDNTEILTKMVAREEVLYERIQSLQEKIQKESRREVLERFGEGPHYIQFNLKLPKEIVSEQFPEISPIVIKMASVEKMPHSVHLFLEQIEHKLWNGCAIVVNAGHILQISPFSMQSTGDSLKKFKDLQLDKLAFQEYNSTYPHNQYTLGFAGRPAGPDFYINKISNVFNHGPGGQEHHALDEEADPCFAKIVYGIEIIDLITTLKTRGAQNILRQEVVIESAEYVHNPEAIFASDDNLNDLNSTEDLINPFEASV